MGDGILFVVFVVVFEWTFVVVDSEFFWNRHIEACLLCVLISMAFDCEMLGVVAYEDRNSFDDEFICYMHAVVADQGSFSGFCVSVVQR